VDDVVTTGATVTALALALKSAGVTRIEVWSIARAREP
jgi:predicted amidophosphoribosyltransferase